MLNKIFCYFCLFCGTWCLFYVSGCTTGADKNSVNGHSPEAWINTCTDWDDWDKPGPPFRIFGNSYYVGTCGITAILITGENGHILIDGGTEAGADIIEKNIKALGFSLGDVKLLLHSHEHFDHVGGLAALQKRSGAKLFASKEAAPVLSSGIVADSDPQAGMHRAFPEVRVDGILDDEKIGIGNLALTPVSTPGHTAGALSWQWTSCEKEKCAFIVYADSLSPISREEYYFSDHPDYVDAYKKGIDKIAGLECDILLAPHPSASQMRERLADAEGLFDKNGCKVYAAAVLKRLNERLEKERATLENYEH